MCDCNIYDITHYTIETYFLITWLEGTGGEKLYDIVQAKTVVPPEDSGILDVKAGMTCRVSYTDGCYYKANVVDVGKLSCTSCLCALPIFTLSMHV